MNNIVLKSERKGLIHTKIYEGYGQILTIVYDGVEQIVSVHPIDPVFGVEILYLEQEPYFKPPVMPSKKMGVVIQNLEQAKLFCMEFQERREEFVNRAK